MKSDSRKQETKISKFLRIYDDEIKNKKWITKDDMTDKGFFSKKHSNGKDIRFIKRKFKIKEHREGTRITKFKIIDTKKSGQSGYRPIRKDIFNDIKKKKCPILGTHSNIEVDHKNGRYNDPTVLERSTQTIDDFQPLSKIANNIKREACKQCKITGERFDAKKLDYPISDLNGERKHNGTPSGCEGCYFYDIKHFKKSYHQIMTEGVGSEGNFSEEWFYRKYNDKNSG